MQSQIEFFLIELIDNDIYYTLETCCGNLLIHVWNEMWTVEYCAADNQLLATNNDTDECYSVSGFDHFMELAA